MLYLTVAVIALSALALAELLLIFGIVRRLREHTTLLNRQAEEASVMLPRGAQVADFAATTADGTVASRETLRGQTLVGFLSPDCGACAEQLPAFLQQAAGATGGPGQVLSVVVGSPADTEELRIQLAPVSRVLTEDRDGPVARAFGVRGYPAFALLDEAGVVVESGWEAATLPTPVPA